MNYLLESVRFLLANANPSIRHRVKDEIFRDLTHQEAAHLKGGGLCRQA